MAIPALVPIAIGFVKKNWKVVVGGILLVAVIAGIGWAVNDWLTKRDELAIARRDLEQAENTLRVSRIKYQAGMVSLDKQRRAHAALVAELAKQERKIDEIAKDHDRPVGPVLQYSFGELFREYGVQGSGD